MSFPDEVDRIVKSASFWYLYLSATNDWRKTCFKIKWNKCYSTVLEPLVHVIRIIPHFHTLINHPEISKREKGTRVMPAQHPHQHPSNSPIEFILFLARKLMIPNRTRWQLCSSYLYNVSRNGRTPYPSSTTTVGVREGARSNYSPVEGKIALHQKVRELRHREIVRRSFNTAHIALSEGCLEPEFFGEGWLQFGVWWSFSSLYCLGTWCWNGIHIRRRRLEPVLFSGKFGYFNRTRVNDFKCLVLLVPFCSRLIFMSTAPSAQFWCGDPGYFAGELSWS